ncbi:MAG: SHOCT domain-containing protein [Pseudomonadales bacterium]
MKNQFVALFFTLLIFSPGSVFAASIFKNGDVIWEAGNNVFFKYAGQDKASFGNNDHPVKLNAKELSAVLGLLKVQEEDHRVSEQELEPAFSVQQTNMLGRYLAQGLGNAKPNQDIIFAMEKSGSRLRGLTTDQYFVAGRAFYKDNKLNVIIGDYDRLRDEGYEAAYDPTHVGIVRYNFDHGSRSKSSNGFKKTIVKTIGVENKRLKNAQRHNWLMIDMNVALEADADKTAMREKEEKVKKRKELEEILGSEETIGSKKATPSLEERFTTLKRLKEKGLITEEEYAQKRKQLLNDL